MPCNQKEADMWLLLVVIDACKEGFENVSVITVDINVAVIAFYHYFDLQIDGFWKECGVREHDRWL